MTFEKKHAPKTLEDVMFNDPFDRKRIEQYVNGERWNNLLFYGPKGTAKSTTARIIAEASGVDAAIYRGSKCDNNTLVALDNEFGWLSIQGAKKPYVIMEEVDEMSRVMQQKLRGLMDETQNYGRFILTTNNRHLLDAPLIDRCDDIEFCAPNIDLMMERAKTILSAEAVDCDEATLRQLLEAGDGSIRRMMRNIEDFILR